MKSYVKPSGIRRRAFCRESREGGDDRKGRPYAGGIFVYKNTFTLLTNVRVVWYNRCNRIQTVEAEITVYVDPTESPGG